jgi:predicted pyridoxine 5'-phosphate oxidase superfamily flavin-nucleotide-binding protein
MTNTKTTTKQRSAFHAQAEEEAVAAPVAAAAAADADNAAKVVAKSAPAAYQQTQFLVAPPRRALCAGAEFAGAESAVGQVRPSALACA